MNDWEKALLQEKAPERMNITGRGQLDGLREQVQAMTTATACRQSAREAIEWRRKRLVADADGLAALLKALPAELPPAADEALWDLVQGVRR